MIVQDFLNIHNRNYYNVRINSYFKLGDQVSKQIMNKRKYLLKKEELYKSIDNNILQHQFYTDSICFPHHYELHYNITPTQFVLNHEQNLKQNHIPFPNPLSYHASPKKSKNKKSMQKITSKSKQKVKINYTLKSMNTSKTTVKKTHDLINFTSNLKQNGQSKTITTNTKLSHHQGKKQKQNFPQQSEKIPLKQIQNEVLNFPVNEKNCFFQANESKQVIGQQTQETQIQCLNYKSKEQQKQQIIDSANDVKPELIDKATQIQECMKIQKQIQSTISNQYLTHIQSRLGFLQEELEHKQLKIKQFLRLLQDEEIKNAKNQNQLFRLYKQNDELSVMLRDFQKIMFNKSNQHQKFSLQAQIQLKQKQTQFKILQAERDTLYRKKDRQNEQISRLNEVISTKDRELSICQQKYQLLTSENIQIIKAYEKMKSQLSQALRINETQRFFLQLAQKTEQKTAMVNIEIESFRCQKCNQVIYGNEATMDDLAKYHLNEKFKTHIQTYQNQVNYWKDQLQFTKIQHQHQILNIRTILQCTYQKSLLDNQSKLNDQIKQLKDKIDIQQEIIQNYKNILEKKSQISKKQDNQLEMNQFNILPKFISTSRSNAQKNDKNDFINEECCHTKADSQLVISSRRLSNSSDLAKNSQLIELGHQNIQLNSRFFSKSFQ